MQNNFAYSFASVTASISGPGGAFDLANGGVANEGISVEPNERVTTQYGAGGNWMHVLHAAKGGKIKIRLMKNGVANSQLSKLFDFDTASPANLGQNIISVRNPLTGDAWTAIGCALTKKPNTVYSTEGPMNEWEVNVGALDGVFGSGSPAIS